MAGVCAGDLRAAQGVFAALQTLGFFMTVLDLPVRWSAWRTLFETAWAGITPRPSAQRITRVGERLDASLEGETIPDVKRVIARFPSPLIGNIVVAPWLPFVVVSALFKTVMFLWTALLLGPPLALLWRSRCLWTDARAARRTLDPETLAKALMKISGLPDGARGHGWLFIGAAGADDGGRARPAGRVSAPSAADRAGRLYALAGVDPPAGIATGNAFLRLLRNPAGAVFLIVLLAILGPLFALLIGLIAYLTAIVMTLGLAGGLAVVLWLV